MNFELEIVNKIKEEESILMNLKYRKQKAAVISEEKNFLMQSEKKESYIKGLRDALYIMQKKQN